MRHLAWLGVGLLVVACQSGAPLGTPCVRASECASPLVCRLGRCRNECVEARDCPAGQVCLVDADHLGACELPAIDVCSAACDTPLVCASGHCRVECTTETDCPSGHVCTSLACERADIATDAGPSDGGGSDGGGDAGESCDPVDDLGCMTSSRCSIGSGLPACVARGGALAIGDACVDDAECGASLSCQGGRCVRVCFVGQPAICRSDLTCSYDSVHGQVVLQSIHGIGLCTQECDLLADTGCTNGGSCALGTDPLGHDFTWCRDVPAPTPALEGEMCHVQQDCDAGLYCYANVVCRRFCDPANPSVTCPGQTCDPITHFVRLTAVGACVP